MYTLRLFNNVDEINREQIYLGKSYIVKGVGKQDAKNGVKLRIYGDQDCSYTDGICVYHKDHAFIMSPNGETFETINRPFSVSEFLKENENSEINIMNKFQKMCCESLSPDAFDAWLKVSKELMSNRKNLKGKELDKHIPNNDGSF